MKLSIINVSYENEILHEGYGKQQGIALGVPTMKGSYDDPENIKRGYNSIIDTFGNHDVPQGWIHTPRPNTTPNTNPGPPVSWNDPTSPDDPQAGYGYIPNDTTKEETFFYHNDHLGSTSYITDDKGNPDNYRKDTNKMGAILNYVFQGENTTKDKNIDKIGQNILSKFGRYDRTNKTYKPFIKR